MFIRKTIGEMIFDALNYALLALISIITIYPLLYTLFASASKPGQIVYGTGILLWFRGFDPRAYELVFTNRNILTGYANTIFYVLSGTLINVFLTLLAAYGLSRRWLFGKKFILMMITFTMFFSGGLIPTYILVKSLGMYNTRWALIIPNAIAVWNIFIMRTYFYTIPDSMEESARIDGARDFTILFKIMAPLAMPVIAVNILFYAVRHWNSWFDALIYLRDRKLYPLQMFLREILLASNVYEISDMIFDPISENVKYATIIVSILPILCLYPFIQRYFVSGMMIGAIKE